MFNTHLHSQLRTLTLLALAGVAACATSAGTWEHTRPSVLSEYGRPGDRVSGAELEAVQLGGTMDALRRLRPDFLRPQLLVDPATNGVISSTPAVYVNDRYVGGLETLDQFPRAAIEEIRFIRPAQALYTWGAQCRCSAGVLHVRTRGA